MNPPSMPRAADSFPIWKYRKDGGVEKTEDFITVEEPLEIRIQGKSIAITMRTPGHDAELAVGFLFTERVINNREQIVEVAHCQRGDVDHPENIINVFLTNSSEIDFSSLTRHVFGSSSCGICGKATIETVTCDFNPLPIGHTVDLTILERIPDLARNHQDTFELTGGLHAACLFDKHGGFMICREDVGRHNAVDKVIGWHLLNQTEAEATILSISGRASFEIVQKAASAGIPVINAISAPSSLALELAQAAGITLVGFHRTNGFNIYTHPERIILPSQS